MRPALRLSATNYAVPALFLHSFPGWFVGIAFAAIAIGALVPAAIMSIACANLFTRNIYREYLDPDCSPGREAQVAKIVSLVVKLGALVFIIALPSAYAIQLQLLGGIMDHPDCACRPAGSLYAQLNPWALLMGWMAGMASGTWMAWANAFKVSTYPLHILGVIVPCYAAVSSLILNLVVSLVLSWLFNAVLRAPPSDATAESDYA